MGFRSMIMICFVLFLAISMASEVKLCGLKQTKMTLYFQDWSGEENSTVIQITENSNGPLNFKKFGTIFCTDDPVTEASSETSTMVARAQGIYVTSALDGSNTHVSISIVFTNEEQGRSTLELQGSSAQFESVREVAVVGGTGKFRFARGYATFETIHYDPEIHYAVIRCNITVLY